MTNATYYKSRLRIGLEKLRSRMEQLNQDIDYLMEQLETDNRRSRELWKKKKLSQNQRKTKK